VKDISGWWREIPTGLFLVSFIYKSEDGFQETKIVLDWPGNSPDLNTIQNL